MNASVPVAERVLAEAETLLRQRHLAGALHAFDDAETSGGDIARCSAGRWLTHMLRGDFEAAWLESDLIRQAGMPDPNRFWTGEDYAGKRLIVRCLHGFGDAVQFLRFAPALRARAEHLIVEVAPAFFTLAPMFMGVDEVITWGEQAPAHSPLWDVQMEGNELPYVLRTTCAELPRYERYIRMPAALLNDAAPVTNHRGSLRVGVVWTSGEWNPSRSVPLPFLGELLRMPGCEFWNLQGGRPRTAWSTLEDQGQLHSAEICGTSIPHLAATIAQLDLVITPDTLAAHLAGALGTPAWVMLEFAADWRWQHARTDSPWYPSLRLFRQPVAGDWNAVVTDLAVALKAYVSQKKQTLREVTRQ